MVIDLKKVLNNLNSHFMNMHGLERLMPTNMRIIDGFPRRLTVQEQTLADNLKKLKRLVSGLSADHRISDYEYIKQEVQRQLAEYNGRFLQTFSGRLQSIKKLHDTRLAMI